jgi:hypothetical protein
MRPALRTKSEMSLDESADGIAVILQDHAPQKVFSTHRLSPRTGVGQDIQAASSQRVLFG